MSDGISYSIKGKTLVISDIHIGLKRSNSSRLSIIVKVFKEVLKEISASDIQTVICCGDLFHSRIALDLQALNVALKLVEAVAKKCKLYLILGNHDLYYKNISTVSSINIFKSNPNIVVVDSPIEVDINGQKALLCPWGFDFSKFAENQYDIIFGHFDINAKYLIASYVEEHSLKARKASEIVSELIEQDDLLQESNGSLSEVEVSYVLDKNLKSNDLVGDFINIVKPQGYIYAGHIHLHKEFVARNRHFIFVGSPYQQNFGEIDSVDGYYVLDEKNKPKFVEITTAPKYVKVRISDIQKQGIDKYDFSIVNGNIIKKIYDIDIDSVFESQINKKISDNLPFEEDLSEYEVILSANASEITNESLELIKKSKLEYIKNYIDTADDKMFKEKEIDKNELFKVLEHYYNKAIENEQ